MSEFYYYYYYYPIIINSSSSVEVAVALPQQNLSTTNKIIITNCNHYF